ncbi:phosphoadenosine phosphosulfate reductase [bacterium F16]|nr:phosphoadenosine phosphosulfate reductase [bacterium F16]
MTYSSDDLERLNQPDTSAEDIVSWSMDTLDGNIALACSFSPEDNAIAHMMVSHNPKARIFGIDTGRLNEETYQNADSLQRVLGITIEWYFPKHDAVESLVRGKGMFSFYESLENRHECCFVRKVEPLSRALSGLDGWITGLRREQSVTRTDLKAVEVDESHNNILKVNPLIGWTQDHVDAYIAKHGIPVNRLIRQGFLSIGCAPCTRAVQPGADARSGRWWWENPEHKECGLHVGQQPEGAGI